jgi:hypothetical protein
MVKIPPSSKVAIVSAAFWRKNSAAPPGGRAKQLYLKKKVKLFVEE